MPNYQHKVSNERMNRWKEEGLNAANKNKAMSFLKITDATRKHWASVDLKACPSGVPGEEIKTGHVVRHIRPDGSKGPKFKVAAIVKKADGDIVAHMSGIRTGLYLGESVPLKECVTSGPQVYLKGFKGERKNTRKKKKRK